MWEMIFKDWNECTLPFVLPLHLRLTFAVETRTICRFVLHLLLFISSKSFHISHRKRKKVQAENFLKICECSASFAIICNWWNNLAFLHCTPSIKGCTLHQQCWKGCGISGGFLQLMWAGNYLHIILSLSHFHSIVPAAIKQKRRN